MNPLLKVGGAYHIPDSIVPVRMIFPNGSNDIDEPFSTLEVGTAMCYGATRGGILFQSADKHGRVIQVVLSEEEVLKIDAQVDSKEFTEKYIERIKPK